MKHFYIVESAQWYSDWCFNCMALKIIVDGSRDIQQFIARSTCKQAYTDNNSTLDGRMFTLMVECLHYIRSRESHE
jgi:hypothetical protein